MISISFEMNVALEVDDDDFVINKYVVDQWSWFLKWKMLLFEADDDDFITGEHVGDHIFWNW